jgi:hypothetical protein
VVAGRWQRWPERLESAVHCAITDPSEAVHEVFGRPRGLQASHEGAKRENARLAPGCADARWGWAGRGRVGPSWGLVRRAITLSLAPGGWASNEPSHHGRAGRAVGDGCRGRARAPRRREGASAGGASGVRGRRPAVGGSAAMAAGWWTWRGRPEGPPRGLSGVGRALRRAWERAAGRRGGRMRRSGAVTGACQGS